MKKWYIILKKKTHHKVKIDKNKLYFNKRRILEMRPFTVSDPFRSDDDNNENGKIKPFVIGEPNGCENSLVKPFFVMDPNGGEVNDTGVTENTPQDAESTNELSDPIENGQCMDTDGKNQDKIEDVEKNEEKQISHGDVKKEQPIQYVSNESAKKAERMLGKNAPYEAKICIAKVIDNIGLDKDFEKKLSQTNGEDSTRKSSFNFSLQLLRIVDHIYDTENGEKSKRQYMVRVSVFPQKGKMIPFDTKVDSDKIKDPNWLKSATDSLATLPKGKDQMQEFMGLVQQCIETDNIPWEIVYPNPGWRDVPRMGWKYVYGGGVVAGEDKWVHADPKFHGLMIMRDRLGPDEIFKKAIGMMDICKTKVASTELFLFVHTTLLATLFERAGHRISFLFGISGVTNSRKTSMALAIAKIFGRGESNTYRADAQFAIATRGGIETMLGIYKDAPVIIDDFKPGSNRQEQKEMDRKLDELARFYGDGVSKRRMTDFLPDKEKKYHPIYGGCVLTMEIVTGVLSSVTRMFITEISVNEVDNEILRFYQENMDILPTHIYDFLSWVTGRFDEIIFCISDKFKEFREQYKFEVARYAEMYATFKITALLLSQYALEKRFWDEEEQRGFMIYIEGMISQELFSMGSRLKNYDKGTLLLKVIEDMVRNVKFTIYSLTPENCANGESCYEDERFYYIQAKILMQAAQNFCVKFNEREQIVNESELFGLLERLEILDIRDSCGKRERSRKLPAPKGNTKRYLYIKKGKLKELLEKL